GRLLMVRRRRASSERSTLADSQGQPRAENHRRVRSWCWHRWWTADRGSGRKKPHSRSAAVLEGRHEESQGCLHVPRSTGTAISTHISPRKLDHRTGGVRASASIAAV